MNNMLFVDASSRSYVEHDDFLINVKRMTEEAGGGYMYRRFDPVFYFSLSNGSDFIDVIEVLDLEKALNNQVKFYNKVTVVWDIISDDESKSTLEFMKNFSRKWNQENPGNSVTFIFALHTKND